MHFASLHRIAIAFWSTYLGCGLAFSQEISSQKQAVSELRGMTTNLQYNKDGSVGLIRFSKPIVNDETLGVLPQFPQLKYLAIVCPQVTDAGLVHVKHLQELDTLLLNETSITSDGVANIAGLVNLEHLSLADTVVDDSAAAAIASLAKLRTLSLEKSSVGDATISEIASLENLEALLLDDTKVSDSCFSHLSRLPKLKLLSLSNCSIQGDGISQLAELSQLTTLVLSHCPIKEEMLSQLSKIKSLKTIELYGTGITAQAIDRVWPSSATVAVFVDGQRKQGKIDPSVFATQRTASGNSKQQVTPPIMERLDDTIVPDFQRHVIPLLGRLGCNGRSCHGSFQGKGGFQLSMFGYDFDSDLENVLLRVDRENPQESLIVNKPTSAAEHEGGKRFDAGSWQQRLLEQWIDSGAQGVGDQASTFAALIVSPSEIVFTAADETVQLRAVAVWSDGSREDVTCLTRFESTDDSVAVVTAGGLVRAKAAGDAHVISYYDNGIGTTQTILPVSQWAEESYPQIPAPTRIDELVGANLKKLGIVPSDLSSDEEFLRRVGLDLIGTLPTPREIEDFLADRSPDKRERKIDALLDHPAYVAWWTTRLCDLTGSNAGYLGNTEMAQPVAEQWRSWIERRVSDNLGWDKIVAGLLTSSSRGDGQSYREFVAHQSTFTRKQSPADYAAIDNPMPHFWFRDNIKIPSDKTLSFGYTFMGLRLDCAQCHKHPFDQWSKQDFDSFTEFFTRIKTGLAPDAAAVHNRMRDLLGVPVKLNTAALRRQSYLRIAAEGRAIPWQEVFIEPPGNKPQPAKLLGSVEVDLSDYVDPRELLMQWLRVEPNRYLAKAFVNRIWANYFGVGIINPTDDLNQANPPSNGALLDHLTEEFIAHRYDMRWLHRTITNSRTYQLSWRPSENNINDERHFSHAILRRLPAEVAIDAILQATAADKKLESLNRDVVLRKISQHPKSYQTRSIDYSLLVFGKPLRTMNCDCERQNSPTLPQALFIRNDQELHQALDRQDGWLAEIAKVPADKMDTASLIQEAFPRTLSRQPRDDERSESEQYVSEAESPLDGMRDLMWALLNTQEFIANH